MTNQICPNKLNLLANYPIQKAKKNIFNLSAWWINVEKQADMTFIVCLFSDKTTHNPLRGSGTIIEYSKEGKLLHAYKTILMLHQIRNDDETQQHHNRIQKTIEIVTKKIIRGKLKNPNKNEINKILPDNTKEENKKNL